MTISTNVWTEREREKGDEEEEWERRSARAKNGQLMSKKTHFDHQSATTIYDYNKRDP